MGKEKKHYPLSDDWLAKETKEDAIGDRVLSDLVGRREEIYRLWGEPEEFETEEDYLALRGTMDVVEERIQERKYQLGIDPTEEP